MGCQRPGNLLLWTVKLAVKLLISEFPFTIGQRTLTGNSGEAERCFRRKTERHSRMIPNTVERSDAGISIVRESVLLRQEEAVPSVAKAGCR